jgi:para-aminobenzoate synthetase component 1
MLNPTKHSVKVQPLKLAQSCSITAIFQHYEEQNWAMLLDSSDSGHPDARFDIIVANPIATVTTTGKNTHIWHSDNSPTEQSTRNPLSLLQNLVDRYFVNPQVADQTPTDLPFLAGALGYFGYDLGRHFESLPNSNTDEYNTPDMAVGIYSWSIIKDNHHNQFYLCLIEGYPHPTATDIESLNNQTKLFAGFSLQDDWQANMDQAQYTEKLAKITAYLTAGDCYQTNLAQRFSAPYKGSEWQAYLGLRKANQAPFSAYIRLTKSVIMSISPERFLSVKNQHVQSKPIKGTRPRRLCAEQDQIQINLLLASEKDQAENLMIVDLLRNDLSKHCQPGSVQVPELFKIETFAAVHHLVSKVIGKLKTDSSALDLLQGSFPGGSITGAPKIRAMEIIDELEPNNRNIYCGSIGYLGINGDMDTSICIRTLLCEHSTNKGIIHCWAGGGIVIDSNPEEEYQESLDKVSKILPLLSASQAQIDIE